MNTNNETLKKEDWLQRVQDIAAQVAKNAGCYLYDLEFQGHGKGRTLSVFIDKDDGVGIDDCSNVSHALNEALDKDDVVPGGEYNLEVSTPGLDRKLKQPWHFEKAVDKKIWIKTDKAFEELGVTFPSLLKTKQMENTLVSVSDGKLNFKNKEGAFQIPISAVEKAHVVFEMKKNLKK